MARTKASVGAKVASGKSSKARCSVAPPSSSGGSSGSSDKSSRNYSGGNPVCPRETPKWQKPITNFFVCRPGESPSGDDDATAGSSKSKPKRNVIHSDDEDAPENSEEQKPSENGEKDENKTKNGEATTKNEENGTNNGENETENGEIDPKPTNHVLDETIELEPLTGEDSHKIDEYYSKNSKGKGIGKKTKGKENVVANVERRNSVKRDLEVDLLDEVQVNKKIKVN